LTPIPPENLTKAMRDSYPELALVRAAAAAADPVYLVGGAVRDLLLGRGRSANLDLVVESDAAALANRLGSEVLEHERFGTATVRIGELEVDVAAARTEDYVAAGALPEVTLGAPIEADLARRDFTLNAMAVALGGGGLIDPHGGRADLESGQLRVLHPESFRDDPTRALRAARYAARLGFGLEPRTEELAREADLGAVSADRREAELLRLASEATAVRGFELLSEWGLVELRPEGLELATRVIELLAGPPWLGFAPLAPSVARAALGPEATGGASTAAERELAAAEPSRPSDAVARAGRRDPAELILARALGADWLDAYLLEWRGVSLEIDGAELIEAGVPEGPAVGRGLAEALRMKLDGELAPGRDGELAAAVAAARDDDGLA
jgi:tRNA nucleotidyltransferase (CCA-adding enzyme)